MTQHPQRCDCLSAVGMSVECLDSYCPSHHKCDHIIKPRCWDCAIYSSIQSDQDNILEEIEQESLEDVQRQLEYEDEFHQTKAGEKGEKHG